MRAVAPDDLLMGEVAEEDAILRLYTLGGGAVVAKGADGRPALGAKGVGLLAYVALQPGLSAARDSLVDLMWSRSGPDQGRASLRQELRRMRIALGDAFDAAIDAGGGRIAFRPGAVWMDAIALEAAARRRDADGLAQLSRLHRGPFLSAVAVPEPDFQDWTAMQASRIDGIALEGLLRQMLLDEAAGRLERAAEAALALLRIDPLQEDVHASLIRILLAVGRVAMAREHLDRCRALFVEELGEEPQDAIDAWESARETRRQARAAPAPRARRDAPEHAADDALSKRPLIAIKARRPDSPNARALAEETAALYADCAWFRVRSCDDLFASGLEAEEIRSLIDYALVIDVDDDAEPVEAEISAARRKDGAVVLQRRVAPVPGDETRPLTALARRIAATATPELLKFEQSAEVARADPPDGDFWRLLMRAGAFYRRSSRETLMAARELLEAALEIHPDDAAALSSLSLTHLMEGAMAWAPDPREAFFLGRETALRAVRHAPRQAPAQYALGCSASLMDAPDAGRPHHLRALELAPYYAPSMGALARIFALGGEPVEADRWADRALAFSPFDPRAASWAECRPLARYAAGDPEEALAELRELMAQRPEWSELRLLAAACLAEMKQVEAARRMLPPDSRPSGPAAFDAIRLTHQFQRADRIEALEAALRRIGGS